MDVWLWGLLEWLREETNDGAVVSLNPINANFMHNFPLVWCMNCVSKGSKSMKNRPGADVINKFKNVLSWNKALWLATDCHMTSFMRFKCFISAHHNYFTLKFVYDIDSGFGLLGAGTSGTSSRAPTTSCSPSSRNRLKRPARGDQRVKAQLFVIDFLASNDVRLIAFVTEWSWSSYGVIWRQIATKTVNQI